MEMNKLSLRRFLVAWVLGPVILLAAFEIYLVAYQVLVSGPPVYHVFFPNTVTVFENDPVDYPGVGGQKQFRTNQDGFRGDDAGPGQTQILFVGGSTTLCAQLDNEETWPAQLCRALSETCKEGYNANIAAKGGLYSAHYPLLVEKALAGTRSFGALVIMPGSNDLEVWVGNRSMVTYSPEVLEATAFNEIPMMATHPLRTHRLDPRALVLYRSLRATKTRLGARMRGVKSALGTTSTPSQQRHWRSQADKVEPDEQLRASLQEYVTSYSDNLTECVRLAREAGVEVVLVTNPMLYADSLNAEQRGRWRNGAIGVSYYTPQPDTRYLSEPALYNALSRFNDATRAVGSANGVTVIDLATMLYGETSLYWDQWHLNAEGARRVGKITSELLINSGFCRSK